MSDSLMPGEVPTIPEPKIDRAIRIRGEIRNAGCEVGAVLSDKIRALMAEMEGPMAQMQKIDPNAKDRLHQAWSILYSVLTEGDDWSNRIKALSEEAQPPQASPSPTEPSQAQFAPISPTPPPTSHPPFIPVVTNLPSDHLS